MNRVRSEFKATFFGELKYFLLKVLLFGSALAFAFGERQTFAAENDSAAAMDKGFQEPPPEALSRCYWWWLNSNVTKEAITRDLEEMKKQGLGGGLIFETDNENWRKNRRIEAGPRWGSPAHRELFTHAMKEADRLGLEITWLIQTGWNLGGTSVQPEEAAKLVTWSAVTVPGGVKLDAPLPQPKKKGTFYSDIAVLAYPKKSDAKNDNAAIAKIADSSHEAPYPANLAFDDDPKTFWVSGGEKPGEGPTAERLEWLEVKFNHPVTISSVHVLGRKNYGPQECELQTSLDQKPWQSVKKFSMKANAPAEITFDAIRVDAVRLMIYQSFDSRNVQITEFSLQGKEGNWPAKKVTRKPIRDLASKIASIEFPGSAPDSSPLLFDFPTVPGEEDARLSEVVDLTNLLKADGRLNWTPPAGKEWEILRFGYANSSAEVVNGCGGIKGLCVDHLDSAAIRSYWRQTVDPFLNDAKPWLGKSLKYIETDSWEMGGMNWSKNFREEFRKRRGYDLIRYMPILAGRIIDNRSFSARFLNDFRRTVADCIAENHYAVLTELAEKNHMAVSAEAGGPHGAPVDALQSLSHSAIPMMEFWAKSPRHRVKDIDRFFVKEAASAAHIYGANLVAAEGFTTIGTHWDESISENLKPTFDRACCEGLNRLVWHQFTCSPKEAGLPGQEYFAGTHFNPQITWWRMGHAFVRYLNRCQFLLQQGRFVADVCYYNGDYIPNLVALKTADPAEVLPEYDYDTINQDALLKRMEVRDGKLVLPDGMCYRMLVMPKHQVVSLAGLRKIAQLVRDGATVVGPKPSTLTGLSQYPDCDRELAELTGKVWGDCDGRAVTAHRYGKGKVLWLQSTKDALVGEGILPDFESQGVEPPKMLDYIHRVSDDAEIYYVCNYTEKAGYRQCTFRVKGKAPELWNPVTGITRSPLVYDFTKDGRITLPLYFESYGSVFVIFRSDSGPRFVALAKDGQTIFPRSPESPDRLPLEVLADKDRGILLQPQEAGKYQLTDANGKVREFDLAAPTKQLIEGPWTVHFPKGWGAPESIVFATLESWTKNSDENIKYFSGEADYRREIDIPAELLVPGRSLELELGKVGEIAEVILNGQSVGILWRAPFCIDITSAARPGVNQLQIKVANFWLNRLIGDENLPPEKRFTRTNITQFKKGDQALLPSGIMGPVTLRSVPIQRVNVKE